ncbi:unnamed protein product [Acanthoscelides obtectus]|uniref:Uncharacterized protein n=1 Tax=Acanthoscelides obtectus TaxID=200917 RepID=A0A9P0JWK0_ACAOB|nr:unnamed protein product [Acanthoscelides obtectus]CAK1647063.1 hypothetical protein AOBTE_LOCUS15027 [Acanthoscelides obtectus]
MKNMVRELRAEDPSQFSNFLRMKVQKSYQYSRETCRNIKILGVL